LDALDCLGGRSTARQPEAGLDFPLGCIGGIQSLENGESSLVAEPDHGPPAYLELGIRRYCEQDVDSIVAENVEERLEGSRAKSRLLFRGLYDLTQLRCDLGPVALGRVIAVK
jgi:hypothetical protein